MDSDPAKKPSRDGLGVGRTPTPLMGMARRVGRGMSGPPRGMMLGMRG